MDPPPTPRQYHSPHLQALGMPLIHPPQPSPPSSPSPRPPYTNTSLVWLNPIATPEDYIRQNHLTHQQNRHAHTNTTRETFLFPRFTDIHTPQHTESHLTFWRTEQTRHQNLLTENRDPLSPVLRERHNTLLRDTLVYLQDLRVNPGRLGSPCTVLQLEKLQWAWDTLCVGMRWQLSSHVSQTSSPLGVGSDGWSYNLEAVGGAAVVGGEGVRLPSIGELVEAVEEVRVE